MNSCIKDNIIKFDRAVPRYTSYPTAPHFQALDERATYYEWLKALPHGEGLSLYFHTPFCPKMCWYCGCHTKITQRYEPVHDYIQLMLKEIDILARKLGRHHKVTHIHFGGGSPSMIEADDFRQIMRKLTEHFTIAPAAEIAIEIDPRGVSEDKVIAYSESGVNRISLGTQDFNDQTLTAVNRVQPFALSANAVQLFRKHGINAINLDLLYGLPYQSPETMTQTIERALLLAPDRVALFGYAHVPWMKKHMRLIDTQTLPKTEARYDLFETGATLLKQAGYHAIGIDHFARPEDKLSLAAREGRLRRNFQGYTDDVSATMLGIGVSSIGKLNAGYIQNAPHMPEYKQRILAGDLPAKKICPITKDDQLRGDIIEQLMCNFEVDISKICQKYGLAADYLSAEIFSLKNYQAQGLITIKNDYVIRILPQARAIARIICATFDSYLKTAPEQPRHSKVV